MQPCGQKEAELREVRDKVKKMENEEKRPTVQFEDTGGEANSHFGSRATSVQNTCGPVESSCE